MKLKLCLLFCLVLILGTINNSYAGFLVRKHTYAADSATASTTSTGALSKREQKKEQRLTDMKTLKHLVIDKHDGSKAKGRNGARDNSGWEGIVALVCGILSLFSVYSALLCIPAIIFGILGLRAGKRNHGLALAGLILGAIAFVIYVLIILLLVAIFGLF